MISLSVNPVLAEMHLSRSDAIVLCIVFFFMICDIVLGLVKAFMGHSYRSNKMRRGLVHKMTFIFCIAFAFVIDFGQKEINLGVNVPMYGMTCTYVIASELGSCLENMVAMNPVLQNAPFLRIFASISDKISENNLEGDK